MKKQQQAVKHRFWAGVGKTLDRYFFTNSIRNNFLNAMVILMFVLYNDSKYSKLK